MSSMLIKNGTVFYEGRFTEMDVLVNNGVCIFADSCDVDVDEVFDASGMHILPGLIDPHVHLREPGYTHKETIKSGTQAAAKGGYTTIMAMPNLKPVPDCAKNIEKELQLIQKNACVHVMPYASITQGQTGRTDLVDFDSLRDYTYIFSDDGKGVQEETTMRKAMEACKQVDGIVVAHCENESLLHGGYVHEGTWAKEHGYEGISSASEYEQVKRDLRLALQTGCQYHICHVSCKESVEAIREYKALGANVSAEVTPHHLLLCDEDISQDDGNWKMNPPLRTKEDRQALVEGLCDGTLDMVATDHAPHSEEEKSKGLKDSTMGIVGLETAFPLLYTNLVRKNIMSLEQLVNCMSYQCADIFGVQGGELTQYGPADLVVVDLQRKEKINRKKFVSMGHNSPFDGWYVYGLPVLTLVNGKVAYRRDR